MSTDLTGTVALITRATSGIGHRLRLGRPGAHVLVGGRNAARGEAVVTSLRASGAKADFIAVDLGSSESARELARRAGPAGERGLPRGGVRRLGARRADRGGGAQRGTRARGRRRAAALRHRPRLRDRLGAVRRGSLAGAGQRRRGRGEPLPRGDRPLHAWRTEQTDGHVGRTSFSQVEKACSHIPQKSFAPTKRTRTQSSQYCPPASRTTLSADGYSQMTIPGNGCIRSFSAPLLK
jgi:short chain dehydrogenase